jgi:hypothetical protein
MDKNDLKVGDEIRHTSSRNTYKIEELGENSFCISFIDGDKWTLPYIDLRHYEKIITITMNITEEETEQLLKEGFMEPTPANCLEAQYNNLVCDYEKVNKAYDKLFEAFLKLNDLNDKLINKLLN